MTERFSPYAHVRQIMGRMRGGLHAWAAGLMEQAGIDLGVGGELPEPGAGPSLVLLPYQVVMESKAAIPRLSLVPTSQDLERESLPRPWMTVARGMTQTMLEHFPTRPVRGPGLGPLHPAPPLSQLPPTIRAWYEAHPEFLISGDHAAGRLPSVMWRQPFALAVRFAALVVDRDGRTPALDQLRLEALGVLAAGIRIDRYVLIEVPNVPIEPALVDLIDAFAGVGGEGSDAILKGWEDARADNQLAVGMTPHHELSDDDLARVASALGIPMQAALVFAIRLSLGAGPELGAGALPHLGSVTKRPGPEEEGP